MARSAQSGRIARSLARRRDIARRTATRLAGTGAGIDEEPPRHRRRLARRKYRKARLSRRGAQRLDPARDRRGFLQSPVELPLGFSEKVASPEEAFRKIA